MYCYLLFFAPGKSVGVTRGFVFILPIQARKLILILTIDYPPFNVDGGSSGDLCRFVVYWEVDYKEGYPEDPNFYFTPGQLF